MADSSVLLEVVLEGKNIKVVQRDLDGVTSSTNKASQATEKLREKSNRFNKGQKGVAGATANGTKAFSKMRNEIGGGSSGLVAAYATLAANLFAATAAFNALRSASKVEQLVLGLEAVGVASGRNLGSLAAELKSVTGDAISTEQALRSTALAASAGFSAEQLKGLAVVAKGASIALGRDMADALDRLVRGTAKLEPEILDELGIFVRLDDAVKDYAESVDKTVGEVSEFERRQAFLNAAISQGKLKFEEIAKSTEANSYDKLAASLGDLAKEFLNIINVAFIPLIEFLTQNSQAIFGLGAIFASTVSKQLIPGLANTAVALAEASERASKFAASQLTSVNAAGKGATVYNNYIQGLQNGTNSIKDAEEGHRGLNNVINGHKGSIAKLSKEGDKHSKSIEIQKGKIEALEVKRAQLTAATNAATASEQAHTRATGFAAIAEGNLKLAISLLTQDVKNYTANTLASTASTGFFAKALGLLKIGAYATATGIKALGLAFLTFLPWIGIVLALAPVIYNFFMDLFPADRVKEATKSITQDLSVITKTFNAYSGSIDEGAKRSTIWIKANTGVLQTAADTILKAWQADQAVLKEAVTEVGRLEDRLKKLQQMKAGIDPKNFAKLGAVNTSIAKVTRGLERAESKLKDMKGTSATAAVAIEQSITLLTSKVDEEGQFFLSPQIEQLKELKKTYKSFTPEEIIEKIRSIKEISVNLASSIEASSDAQKEYSQEMVAFSSKSSRPYSSLLEKTVALEKTYVQMKISAGAAGLSVKDLAEQQNALSKAGFDSLADLSDSRKKISSLQENYLEKEAAIVKTQEELNTQERLSSKNSVAMRKFQIAEADFLEKKLKHLEDRKALETSINDIAQKRTMASIEANNKLIEEAMAAEVYDEDKVHNLLIIKDTLESQLGVSQGIKKVDREIAKTKQSQAKNQDLTNKATILQVQETSKILDLYNKIIKQSNARKNIEMKIAQVKRNIALIESGEGTANAMNQYQTFLDEKKAREDIIEAEFAATAVRISMEYDLLEARNMAERARVASTKGVGEEELQIYTQIEGLLTRGRQASLDAAVQSYILSKNTLEEQDAALKRASDIFSDTGGLQLSLDISKASQTVEKVLIDQQNKTLQSRLAVIDAERQLEEDRLRAENEVLRGAKNRALSEAQITELNRKEQEAKTTLLTDQFLNQVRIINMEYDLLKAKTTLQKANMLILKEELKARAAALPEGEQRIAAIAAAESFGNTIEGTFDSVLGPGGTLETARNSSIIAASSAFSAALSGLEEKIQTSEASSPTARGTFGEGTTYGNIAEMDKDSATAFNKGDIGDKVAKMGELVSPMIETLKTLGPEGEVVAALSMASFAIVDTWDQAFEKMGKGLEGMATVASAAAQTIGAISSIMQAASRANIAEIDNQIKAEQKRDGKSKESIAKIKKLEAQKEKEKKKAFEQNKKMMMAQTLMSTAAAIMQVWSDPTLETFGKIAMTALVAGLGAAQLGIIAGTSYQGGGGSSSSGNISSPTLEVGKRTSSVDVAKSQGAAGELAYFRGGKGTGGPENFTPAFMGAKYRNEGGPTAGYTVGEQGPELFVPSVPGTIVPNEEMNQTPQNVNISINAIDSQGVEQVLVEQRGNIIGMIRDAANNIGEDFYEEIETAVYTPSSAGARLY